MLFIPRDTIKKTLFFDIETTTRYKTWQEYKEKEPYSAGDFEGQVRMRKEWDGVPIEEVYWDKGMLSPEHGQVVAIGCRIWGGEKWEEDLFGFSSWEEWEEEKDSVNKDKNILIRFNELLIGLFGKERGTLGGYNINGFDIPFLYRRMLRSGIYPQKSLVNVGIKPWELKNLELKDWWSGVGANGWSGFSSACEMMGVGTSKEDGVDGRQVCRLFWDDKDVNKINEYCVRDVQKSTQFALSLSEESLRERHQKTMEEWKEKQNE